MRSVIYNNDNFTGRKIHIYLLKYRCKQLCHQNQATDEIATTPNTLIGRDLKCDVYHCYLTAKEDPRIGYMSRPKEKWDEIPPEYSFLTDKNLRDQASRIEKNKDVMDTEYVHFGSNNNSQVDE